MSKAEGLKFGGRNVTVNSSRRWKMLWQRWVGINFSCGVNLRDDWKPVECLERGNVLCSFMMCSSGIASRREKAQEKTSLLHSQALQSDVKRTMQDYMGRTPGGGGGGR